MGLYEPPVQTEPFNAPVTTLETYTPDAAPTGFDMILLEHTPVLRGHLFPVGVFVLFADEDNGPRSILVPDDLLLEYTAKSRGQYDLWLTEDQILELYTPDASPTGFDMLLLAMSDPDSFRDFLDANQTTTMPDDLLLEHNAQRLRFDYLFDVFHNLGDLVVGFKQRWQGFLPRMGW